MKILLLGNASFVEDSVRSLSYNYKICGVSYSIEEALALIDELSPDAVIIDADIRGGGIANGIEIRKRYKNIKIFVASDYISLDILQRAVSNGLSGVLKKPLTPAHLAETLQKIEKYGSDYITKYSEDVQKEVIVFYSPKGGVGKTTLAVNTAGLISTLEKKLKVVIADFDVWANVEVMLQIKHKYSISDWYSALSDIGEEEFENYVYKHPAGFHVIPGIRRITESSIFTHEFIARFIEALKNLYDVIIIDTNSVLNDGSAVLFDKATRIFLVGTMEIPTLKGLHDLKEVLELMGIMTPKIRMVLNRIPENPDLSLKEIAELIPFPLVAKIKENPDVRSAVNKGEVYTVKNPHSEFACEIARLAAGIVQIDDLTITPARGKKPLLGILAKGRA